MGSGTWTTCSFANYVSDTRGLTTDAYATKSFSAQEMYTAHGLNSVLNPYKVMRECCDSDEHPETLPVILALDVTGSMGDASVRVAQKLNEIMTELYADENVKDIEFCIMGIGDLSCDAAPIQMSQFESDIRIAEQLDKLYFEGGGGGNKYESYSAAWYMGVNHCDLDCWKRGKKGIIITMGDELPNPYLPKESWRSGLEDVTGDSLQGDVDTKELLEEASQKFDIYHISVKDGSTSYERYNERFHLDQNWSDLLGADHYTVATLDNLSNTIVDIVKSHVNDGVVIGMDSTANEVSW